MFTKSPKRLSVNKCCFWNFPEYIKVVGDAETVDTASAAFSQLLGGAVEVEVIS